MPRKGGLGKGLDALIPGESSASDAGTSQIPVELIIPNPRQPRQMMNEDNLQELAASIREHGILQPLIVTHDERNNQYILIAGERRLRASRLAGLATVPVLIRQVTEQQRLELALIENVQRADLTPLETAEAYRQLSEEFNLAHEDIAARVGKSRSTVTNTLRLLKLPTEVRRALAEETISEGHARALLSLTTARSQVSALQTIITQGMTVRQTEELVRKLNGEKQPRPARREQPPEVRELEDRLQHRLGTRVSLRHGKKGGTLTIHYYSQEELDSLLGTLLEE